jgi:hypothetical protein
VKGFFATWIIIAIAVAAVGFRGPIIRFARMAIVLNRTPSTSELARADGRYYGSLEKYARKADVATPMCISEHRMDELGGDLAGFTSYRTKRIWLLRSVCREIHLFDVDRPRRYDNAKWVTRVSTNAEGIEILFHEAAHAHGTRSERGAECSGTLRALKLVKPRYPRTYPQVVSYLLWANSKRPPACRLNATCPQLRRAKAVKRRLDARQRRREAEQRRREAALPISTARPLTSGS